MKTGSPPRLTDKQSAVMERIDRRVPIKMIAGELSVSESRINQHVRKLKDLYGAENMNDLVASYRALGTKEFSSENGGNEPFEAYRKPASRKSQLPDPALSSDQGVGVDPGELVFSDALQIPLDAPWTRADEAPRVVPGMLDGDQAVFSRLAVILSITVGIIIAVVLVVTVSVYLTEALDGKARVPVEELQKPAD